MRIKTLARSLAVSTGLALVLMAQPASAQLVNAGDLVSAQDSAGNPGQLAISNPNATTANISVLAPVVVSNWNNFSVPNGSTLNIANASSAANASLLARVIGGGPSDIGGTINANGTNLWLVNQNGIFFGENAVVNANSFLASTLDLSDADYFDYFEGTNIAGNGTGNVRFQTNPFATTYIASFGGTVATKNGLAFISPALNIDGVMDAGNGKATFLMANDVTVGFSAGSPVSYSLNAGTAVDAQQISGTVRGKAADFVMYTASGVTNAMLSIDANVATTATPTSRGILLLGTSMGSDPVAINASGSLQSTGQILSSLSGNLTLAGAVVGSSVDLVTDKAITVANVTATGGDISAYAGGALVGGNLAATGAIALDTPSVVQVGSLTANADGIGAEGVRVGTNFTPASIKVTGATSGGSVQIRTLGNMQLGNVTSTGGTIDLDSTNGTINAGAVSANGGSAMLTAPGTVTTSSIASTAAIDVDSTGSGVLNLGNLNAGTTINLDTSGALRFGSATAGGAFAIGATVGPSSITATGNISAGSIDFDSTGLLDAQGITATAGGIDIDTGSVKAGALAATAAITVDAAGSIALTSANADSDSNGSGVLVIGGNAIPSSLTITGPAKGVNAILRASGPVSLGNVTSTGGVVDIDSTTSTINADAVSATGGDALLTARGAVTTSSIASTTGAIDVDSTNGGALNLGNLNAATNVALDTTGTLTAGAVTAGGSFTAGGTQRPSALTLTGNASAGSIALSTTGALSAKDLAATTSIALDAAGAMSFGSVSAPNAPLIIGAVIQPTSVTSTGAINVASLTARTTGALSLSGANTIGQIDNVTAGGSLLINTIASTTVAGTVTGASDVTLKSGGDLTIASTGGVTGGLVALSANGNFVNNSGSDAVTASDHWVVYSNAPAGNVFGASTAATPRCGTRPSRRARRARSAATATSSPTSRR